MIRATLTAALFVCASGAAGDITLFTADISGANEVPGNASPATGTLTGTYDDVANEFSFSWSITDSLIGDPAAPGAHIHNAPAGSNGGIVFAMSNGVWNLNDSDVWSGLSAGEVSELFAGNLYVNFHTTQFGGGEVRGQIFVVPAPASAGVLAGMGLLCVRRRR